MRLFSANDEHMRLLKEQLNRTTPGSKAHGKISDEIGRLNKEWSSSSGTRVRPGVGGSGFGGGRRPPGGGFYGTPPRHHPPHGGGYPGGNVDRDLMIGIATVYALAIGGSVGYGIYKDRQLKKRREEARAKAVARRRAQMRGNQHITSNPRTRTMTKPYTTYTRTVNGKQQRVRRRNKRR